MTTNIGGVPLGSLVLGNPGQLVDPLDQHIQQTITFTQEIGLNKKPASASSVLNLTQTIVGHVVRNRSLTDTLVFTQIIKRIREFSVTSTISFTQSETQTHDKPVSVNQSIGLSHAVTRGFNASRLIVQSLNWAHIRAYNGTFNRALTSNLVFNQAIIGNRVRTVASTLSFAQVIAYQKYKHVQHHIELQQSLTRSVNYIRSINTLFIPFQVIQKTILVNRTVPQTLNLVQTIVADRVKGVTNNLIWSQTVAGYAAKAVKNTLPLAHNISYNHSHNVTVDHVLNLEQGIGITHSKNVRVKSYLGFNSFVKAHKEFNLTVTSTLGLTQEIRRNVFSRTIPQSLVLTQTIGYIPVRPRTVTHTLNLQQSVVINKVYNRTVLDNLAFLNERTVYVGMGETQYLHIPGIQYSLTRGNKKKFCVLQTPGAAVTLPSPEWNDAESYGGIFNIRRAMNGTPYTYVRQLDLRKLSLQWILDAAKAAELREFLIQNNARIMTLTTWKGDKWFVHLQTNPTEFTPRGRADVAFEKVEVSLEFEGLKVM